MTTKFRRPFNADTHKPGDRVETRGGAPARVLATDVADHEGDSVVVAVLDAEGVEAVVQLPKTGRYYGADTDSVMDLFTVVETSRAVRFFNVYPVPTEDPKKPKADTQFSRPYKTREDADKLGDPGRVACIEVELEYFEGQGL